MRTSMSGNFIVRLTKDPELRTLPGGKMVADLAVAHNERYRDSKGEWKERASFMDATIWGKAAENAAKYLKTGSNVYIEVSLSCESYASTKFFNSEKKPAMIHHWKANVNRITYLDPAPEGSNRPELEAADQPDLAAASTDGDETFTAGLND